MITPLSVSEILGPAERLSRNGADGKTAVLVEPVVSLVVIANKQEKYATVARDGDQPAEIGQIVFHTSANAALAVFGFAKTLERIVKQSHATAHCQHLVGRLALAAAGDLH
jgi:hypothetical protein